MGHKIYDLAKVCKGYNSEYIFKGFLDDYKDKLESFNGYPPVINIIKEYVIECGDLCVCSMGDVVQKK